ncbi:protein Smaug homolog 1-like [Penaeus monodon]|uniref:protein Smaug homolog 1-like n=1 Tax=Penaeus monodon TaxID=6687 RepID=UPI0018A6EC8F|nr:protein Smaug homolog 1-like [Penaeus monodon]
MSWCGGGASAAVGAPGDAPQSPNNSATSSRSSGCDSNTEEPCQPHPGMRDVGVWLKSLRLHKYSPLLCNLTYEELLALDEATLESQGVTKGARHKIVLSIAKLKERHKQLVQIEKEVMNGGNLFCCLNDLKSIILTPFPPYTPPTDKGGDEREALKEEQGEASRPAVEGDGGSSIPEDDLPSQFTRVMGKENIELHFREKYCKNFNRIRMCTQLLVSVRPEDECVTAFLGLVEKCVNHEAFTLAQTRRLQSWKQQIIRVWHPLPPKTKDSRHTRATFP